MTKVVPIMLPDQMEPISHYCHGVRAGDRLWISGMVGVRLDGSIPEDVAEQFDIALDYVDGVLRSQGGKPHNIVKVQVFLTNVDDRTRINPRRQAYFGDHRPASTLVQVAALVSPELKVEIEAEAVLD